MINAPFALTNTKNSSDPQKRSQQKGITIPVGCVNSTLLPSHARGSNSLFVGVFLIML
jgi:hypothetical protein